MEYSEAIEVLRNRVSELEIVAKWQREHECYETANDIEEEIQKIHEAMYYLEKADRNDGRV
jgi:prefoldin subunit 5